MPLDWAIVAAIAAIVSSGVAYVESAKARKRAKRTQEDLAGVLVNKNSNNAPIPVIYGTRRVGITRVFVSTQDAANGDPNEFLYICGVLCEGEVESISDVEIDGLPTNDSRFDYTDSISINYHYGTDNQTVDTLLQEANSNWTSDHRLRGVAYLAIRLKYNSDAFSGIPEITALVEGRKVYDPRTTTTAFSANPALCIRDYLTNSRYGKGLDSSQIDDTAFEAAADECDTTVTYYDSSPQSTGPLFECNAVLDTGESLFANMQRLLLGCRGFLPYTQGVYSLVIDSSQSSSFDFTTDHIIGGIQIKGENKKEKANRFIVSFVNSAAKWQEDTAVWPDPGSAEETALLAEDNGTLLQRDIDLETITDYYMAREMARILTQRSRNALRCTFRSTSEALQLTVADVVTVTHGTPGWSSKPFQVEEIGLNDDGTCQVQLLEYDSSLYTWDEGSEQRSYPDTNLPNPYSVEAPTSLVATTTAATGPDGGVVPIVQLSWTAPDDGFVYEYEVQYKLSTDSDYFSIFTKETRLESAGATVGKTYDVRVRAVNALGVNSAWLSDTYTPGGTAGVIQSAGIAAPTDPRVWLDIDPAQPKVKARVEVTIDLSSGAVPDDFVIAYAYTDEPNQLAISSDTSDKLYLDESNEDTGIAGSFTLTAAAGSTTTQINYTDPSGAIDIDLSGKWWVSVDDGATPTRFHKVHRVTPAFIEIPPGETLSITPSNGDTINVLELDWHDARSSDFKLVYINQEVIKHNGIDYDGNYYLDVVTRGAEGTSEADQSGQTANYFPSIGPGSFQIPIPLAEFGQVGSSWVFSGEIDIDLPTSFGWAALSCYFRKKASGSTNLQFVRGNIVSLEYAGSL